MKLKAIDYIISCIFLIAASFGVLFTYNNKAYTHRAVVAQEDATNVIHFDTPYEIVDGNLQEGIDLLRALNKDDKLIIHLNTIGGDVYEALRFISAIREAKGIVLAIAEGYVFSAGAWIAMASPTLVVMDTAIFMFHDPVTPEGKPAKGPLVDKIKEVVAPLVIPVLTEREAIVMAIGGMVWISAKDMKKRLKLTLTNNKIQLF